MKTQISQAGLRDIVAWAAAAVPPRVDASKPSLAGVRLEASGDVLTAAAYDYQVARRWSAPAQNGEPGVALPPARVLADVVGGLPAKPVELETDAGEGILVITCGAATYVIPLLDARAYPDIPETPAAQASLAALTLVRAVERVAGAADPANALPYKTVVRLEPGADSVTMVATDGYRISTVKVPCEMADAGMPAACIPAGALRDWARAMKAGGGGRVALGFGLDLAGAPNVAGLADGSRETSIRLTALDGGYPAWQKWAVLPARDFMAAEVDTAGLLAAVKPLAALIPPLSPLYLTFTPGEVRLATGRASGRASGADSFAVDYDGPRIQIAFRAQFLADALAATGGVATMIMTDPAKAVYLTPVTESGKGAPDGCEQFLHVVLPIGKPVEPPSE